MLIDTGPEPLRAPRWSRCEVIADAAADAAGDGASQAQIDAHIVTTILGELRGPRKAETVRRHFVGLWPIIAPLADREPEQFDAIILELADRLSSLG
jgi:nucleotide-binding universal stress UspA family protein